MEDTSSSRSRTNDHKAASWINNPNRLLTVEIIIFLYGSGILLEIPVIQQYLYHKAREELQVTAANETDTVCNPSNLNSSEYRLVNSLGY